MGLPFAPITIGFPGMAEPGAAQDAASPRTAAKSAQTQAAMPSPSGRISDAESAGTQTTASPQTDSGSDAPNQYPLSDAAIISLQLRAMQGNSGALDEKPNAAPQAKQSTDGPLDLSSQESELESALQSMGISAGAVQEFMYMGQVLAQAAPGLFQDFVAQMVNLADIYKQAKLPGLRGSIALGKDTKPQSELQLVTIEESQASVSVTQSPTGETVSVSAQEEALTFVNFEDVSGQGPSAPSQGPSKSTAKPRTAASERSSAPHTTPARHTAHTSPAIQQA